MISRRGLRQVECGHAIKKDRGNGGNRLRLASAPADIQAFVAAKADSMRAVIYLLDIEDPAERAPIIEQLLQRTLTTEDLPAYLAELRQRTNASPALLAKDDAPGEPPPSLTRAEYQQAATATPVPGVAATAPISDTSEHTPGIFPAATSRSSRAATLDLSQDRVRQGKLKTIVRYLNEYRRSLADLAEVPAEELALLRQIEAMVQELT